MHRAYHPCHGTCRWCTATPEESITPTSPRQPPPPHLYRSQTHALRQACPRPNPQTQPSKHARQHQARTCCTRRPSFVTGTQASSPSSRRPRPRPRPRPRSPRPRPRPPKPLSKPPRSPVGAGASAMAAQGQHRAMASMAGTTTEPAAPPLPPQSCHHTLRPPQDAVSSYSAIELPNSCRSIHRHGSSSRVWLPGIAPQPPQPEHAHTPDSAVLPSHWNSLAAAAGWIRCYAHWATERGCFPAMVPAFRRGRDQAFDSGDSFSWVVHPPCTDQDLHGQGAGLEPRVRSDTSL